MAIIPDNGVPFKKWPEVTDESGRILCVFLIREIRNAKSFIDFELLRI